MLQSFWTLSTILALVLVGASSAHAQAVQTPKPPASAKSGPIRPKNLKPAVRSKETARAINVGEDSPAPAAGALSNAQLKTLLEGMGYEVEALGEGDSVAYSISEDGWKLIISLSPDASTVWVSAYLQKVPDPASAPADKLLGILSWNGSAAHFVYFADSQQLWIERDIANSGIKPAAVRKVIVGVSGVMTNTFDLWKDGALAAK